MRTAAPQVSSRQGRSRRAARRYGVGAEILPDAGVDFRVWAPSRRRVEVRYWHGGSERTLELAPEDAGYFRGVVEDAGPGTRYGFLLDEDPKRYPDPASRYQPEGPHGPSEVVDPRSFQWTDADWRGLEREGQIFYELHVGTFTPEGTWRGAERQLERLARLGVTALEIMPVGEFPGSFNWGYDGVDLYAPSHLYGGPDDFRRFVDAAHRHGLGVLLDVVYNHLGPDGNYLGAFSPEYFTDRYENEWGDAINFDGERSGPVREFFRDNAAYWIDEFHLDGLRLDATQSMRDASRPHILVELVQAARAAAGPRSVLIVAENEPQEARLARPIEAGGYGIDALWNDDFHHSAMVALTGRTEAYYSDYRGSAQEFVSAVKHGFLFQGQRYVWQGKRRGTPSRDLPYSSFVQYIQNHDQIANSARGERIHQLTSPGRWRAVTALLLLGPAAPLLFQGQEFAASTPFLFFADHKPELAAPVRRGRAGFLRQFRTLALPEIQRTLADPAAPETFERCKLSLSEVEAHAEAVALHSDLIALRRSDPTLQAVERGAVDGAVLTPEAFVIRVFGRAADDRLLVVNLGGDVRFEPAPEPLLAPPEAKCWERLWASEAPQYGGLSVPPLEEDGAWRLPAECAVLLRPGDR